MSEQVHETIPSVVMPPQAESHISEYGAEAGGILLVATAGYVAVRGFIQSKINNRQPKVREEFHMPPASTYDEIVVEPATPEATKPKVEPEIPEHVRTPRNQAKEKPQAAPEPEVDNGSLETNRRTSRYVQVFFGVSSGDPQADQEYIDEVSRLSHINIPESLPDEVRDEVPKIIHEISRATKGEPGNKISLFNTQRKGQPSGLSLAVALTRIGFSTHKVKAQYDENVDFVEDTETMTTYAELKGKNSVRIDFGFDGVDTKVTFVRQDLSKPVSKPEDYEPPRGKKDVKRARPHGHDIMGYGSEGVSTGRKRGVMPPGGSSGY